MPRLPLLDALRGVAALIVLWFHCYEGFGYEVAPGTGIYTQTCDHGYLAVDFFFLLSGFVIGYAYDRRWADGLGIGHFFRRRLIRLHPMVIAGGIIGLAAFLIGGSVDWWGHQASTGSILLIFFMTLLMLPAYPGWSADVRGNGEMFPLNGPTWSLFFEYIGNILYALLLRRLSNRSLTVLVTLSGLTLSYMVLRDGYLGMGWSFIDQGFLTGMLRMLFPYSLGMLMARKFMERQQREAHPTSRHFRLTFLICALVLLVFLPVPFVGSPFHPWQNGLYILFIILVLFPLVVWFAAQAGAGQSRLSTFLGELSYPLYAVHYPLMYLFYQHIGFPDVHCTMADVWPLGLGVFLASIALATLLLYLYDRPVRRWLNTHH